MDLRDTRKTDKTVNKVIACHVNFPSGENTCVNDMSCVF